MNHLANHSNQPHLITRECEELDVWSAQVGWDADYRQRGNGGFDAWFRMSLCHDLRVVEQYCSRETFACGIPPAGHLALVIPLNEGDRGIFQGKRLADGEAAIMAPQTAGTYQTPPHLRMLSLLFPIERIARLYTAATGEPLDPLICETRLISLDRELVKRLTRITRQMIEVAPGVTAAQAPSLWLRELEQEYLTTMTRHLAAPDDDELNSRARKNRVKYVLACRDYIETHLDQPLGLETLTHELGVSPRTLEYAFREIYQTTPMRYVKTRRLHAARRRLLDRDAPSINVTNVALDYGFKHLSHFARDYRELFGEHPSVTLATPGN